MELDDDADDVASGKDKRSLKARKSSRRNSAAADGKKKIKVLNEYAPHLLAWAVTATDEDRKNLREFIASMNVYDPLAANGGPGASAQSDASSDTDLLMASVAEDEEEEEPQEISNLQAQMDIRSNQLKQLADAKPMAFSDSDED